jgi:hypothetical protein
MNTNKFFGANIMDIAGVLEASGLLTANLLSLFTTSFQRVQRPTPSYLFHVPTLALSPGLPTPLYKRN